MEIGPDRLYGITGHNREPEAHRNRSLPALSLSLSLASQDISGLVSDCFPHPNLFH